MIRITYEARHALPLDEVADFQGDAKTITRGNLDKLKRSIKKHGFFVPLFVWRKGSTTWIIDGHQRRKALLELRDEGEEVPPIPVEYIDAKSKKDAAEKLLAITSQFGEFDRVGLADWMAIYTLKLDEYRLVDVDLTIAATIEQPAGPDSFAEMDEEIETEHECPSCGYRWSGASS